MLLLSETEINALTLTKPVPLTIHPAAVYLGSLAPGSQPTMRSALNAIALLLTNDRCDAMTLDWSKLRYRHTAAIRTALSQKLSATTVNKMLVALRRVLQEAYRLDLIDANDYAKAADLKSLNVQPQLRGRTLKRSEIKRLIATCLQEQTVISLRDAAIICLLRCGGIRRDELVQLELDDLDLKTGAVIIRHGKGNKTRTVYLNNMAVDLVKQWLAVRGDEPGALVCPINKGGRITIKHFQASGDAIYKLIKGRAKKAGIAHFSPHDFRRTFCSDLLAEGEDVFTVQDLAGHASPVTTKKYDRRGENVKRRAVKKLKF